MDIGEWCRKIIVEAIVGGDIHCEQRVGDDSLCLYLK